MSFTKLHHGLFDLIPQMTDAELRVTLTVLRETTGWQRHEKDISLSEFQESTGLSRQGVINGISAGLERGTLIRTRNGQRYCYRVLVNEVDQTSQPSRPVLVNEVDQTSQRNGPELVNEIDQTSQPSRPVLVNQVDQNTPMLKKTKEKPTKEKKETLVGGYTNQPTNGAGPSPANRTPSESPSLALLLEMGVGESVAEELIQMRSFEQIRRQVFGWLKERRAGKAEIGLLVYRIRKDASCSDPDPDIDRGLWRRYQTPEEKQAELKLNQELAGMLHRRPKSTPKPESPTPDDPWRITVAETATQMPYGVLERAQAEIVGEDQEAQIWRIELDAKDAAHLPWLQTRGLTLLRRTLASCVGRGVRVDVVLPEQVPA